MGSPYYEPTHYGAGALPERTRETYITADPVSRELIAVGTELGFVSGKTFHRIVVSMQDGEIIVGCTTMSVKAWRNLKNKVESLLAARTKL